eukprot:CAMPEP_0183713566 /NCGR_PEP_ID=MMETSP0737-20130205/8377_1 /TAXON_ID=385413 /ORGANISM="Thalassiosira miniscula, Strain CCMP1093" /LENGTH=611 /DNA_ID=CAMNT_0025942365 /DNA_START=228 /DNA_END=2061 /DNA_ORIENTATION=+
MVDDTDTQNAEGETCHSRSTLKSSLHRRAASLTAIEKTFLHALLIDKPSCPNEEQRHQKKIQRATKVLNDEILFSVPIVEDWEPQHDDGTNGDKEGAHSKQPLRPKPPKPTRSNHAQIDLWKAHNDGVGPRQLVDKNKSSKSSMRSKDSVDDRLPSSGSRIDQVQSTSWNGKPASLKRHANHESCAENNNCAKDSTANEEIMQDETEVDSLDVLSDQEVGTIHSSSSASSWRSSQGGYDHYDAWEVLRDEYAKDFGFHVAVDDENTILPCTNDDDADGDGQIQRGLFKILGTSADDAPSLPHVLSPPLMDSLLNFIPDHLAYDNFWLKFSLIRDGACLDTLKRYCRAATHTIIAIETTDGRVFGSFSSAPWRTSRGYFGTGESFLWRMRHSRNTPVHSLFEQAQLESEIDVFMYNGSNDYIQLCTSDKLALGGGTTTSIKEDSYIQEVKAIDAPAVSLEDDSYGFGLALDENLLHGTTSPSATFGNSNLITGMDSGELFDVTNLEVWGFTSAQTEKEAQQSEMSMFFVRESISSNLSSRSSVVSASNHTSTSSLFSGEDLNRDRFYRRMGQGDDNEEEREAWRYANMMNPVAGSSPYVTMGGGIRHIMDDD